MVAVAMSVGELDVLESGSVIGGYEEPIEFVLDDGDGALTVRFVFKDDDTCADGQVEPARERRTDKFIAALINFNNPLGTSAKEPLEVGVYDDRVLYFKYFIFGTKGGSKLVHYTWLLGESVEE